MVVGGHYNYQIGLYLKLDIYLLQFHFQIHPWLPIVNPIKEDDEDIEMVEKGKENKVEAKMVEENEEK